MISYRYFGGTSVLDEAGRPVEGLKARDIGAFAAPEYDQTRNSYLKNLRAYRTLAVLSMPEAANVEVIAAQVRPALERQLRENPRNRPMLARITPELEAKLADRVALVLARLGGLSMEEYTRRAAAGGAVLKLPANRPLLQYVCDTHLGGQTVPEHPSEQETAALFGRLFDLLGEGQVEAFCLEPGGFFCALEDAAAEVRYASALEHHLSAQLRELFIGSLSQAGFIFFVPPQEWDSRRGSLLRAQLAVVVRTRGGNDMYPILIELFLDGSEWRLARVSRQVSPRMAMTAHVVF